MSYCAVKWCRKSSKTSGYTKDGITFHRFPKCPEYRIKWMNASCRRGEWVPKKYSVMCSIHFTEDNFHEMKNRRRLMDSAVPTLNLPVLTHIPSVPPLTSVKNPETTVGESPSKSGADGTSTHHLKSVREEQQAAKKYIQEQDTSDEEDDLCDDQEEDEISEENDEFAYFARCLANQLRRLPELLAFDLMQEIKLMVSQKTPPLKDEKVEEIRVNPLSKSNNSSRKRPAPSTTTGTSEEPRHMELDEHLPGKTEDISFQQQQFSTVTIQEERQQQQTDQGKTIAHAVLSESNKTLNSATTSLIDPLSLESNNLVFAVIPDMEEYVPKVESEEDVIPVHSVYSHSHNPHIRPTITSTPEALSEHLSTSCIEHPTRQDHGDLDQQGNEYIIKEPYDGEYIVIGTHSRKK